MHHTNNRDSTVILALSSLSFSLTSPSSPIHHLRRRNAHRHPHHTSRLRSRFPLRRSCLAPVPPISRSESTREQQHPQLLAPASHYRARCCSSLRREDGNPTSCSSCCSCGIPSISWPRPIPTSLSFPWRISMALNTSSKRTKWKCKTRDDFWFAIIGTMDLRLTVPIRVFSPASRRNSCS